MQSYKRVISGVYEKRGGLITVYYFILYSFFNQGMMVFCRAWTSIPRNTTDSEKYDYSIVLGVAQNLFIREKFTLAFLGVERGEGRPLTFVPLKAVGGNHPFLIRELEGD